MCISHQMLSMVTDLMFILSILVLLFFTSLGSYWFLSYCFPDANYANIDSDQLNRERINHEQTGFFILLMHPLLF